MQQSAGELKESECDIYLAQDEEGNLSNPRTSASDFIKLISRN